MRIGMVGYKFMGRAHSHAYRTAPYFFDIKGPVELAAVCGRDEAAVAAFAQKHGWQSYETDWRKLVERADIDAIDSIDVVIVCDMYTATDTPLTGS